MDTLKEVVSSLPWFAWVAIIALILSMIKSVIAMTHAHTERMEKIKHGEG
jgi:hypothetical protein